MDVDGPIRPAVCATSALRCAAQGIISVREIGRLHPNIQKEPFIAAPLARPKTSRAVTFVVRSVTSVSRWVTDDGRTTPAGVRTKERKSPQRDRPRARPRTGRLGTCITQFWPQEKTNSSVCLSVCLALRTTYRRRHPRALALAHSSLARMPRRRCPSRRSSSRLVRLRPPPQSALALSLSLTWRKGKVGPVLRFVVTSLNLLLPRLR